MCAYQRCASPGPPGVRVRPVYSHVADDYDCPVCRGLRGGDASAELIQASDIVGRNEVVAAVVCSHFLPGSPGHVIVVPVRHYENLYAMPQRGLHACIDMAQAVALAMKVRYGAAGITMRQNNEPAGSQTVFHFHLHVIPRYEGDGYDNGGAEYLASVEERGQWATRLTAGGQLIRASASADDA
jgi:histidine triad (HIT) family protein